MDILGSGGLVGCLVLAGAVLWKVIGTLIYRYARFNTTILDDLPKLGLPRTCGKLSGTAVVAGGSIAGLMTARVLSIHFEKVVVIEPDTELEHKRTRVGQWNQLHGFLPILHLVLARLFPRFDTEAERAGHRIVPLYVSNNVHLEGKGVLVDPSAMPKTLTASRMGLERLLRSLLQVSSSNVSFVVGTVTGLQPTSDGHRIEAVQVRMSHDSETISTSFFVDCTGPVCGSSQWLPRLNRDWTAKKETYDPLVGYSTGFYDLSPEQMTRFNKKLPAEMRETVAIRQVYGSLKSGSRLGFIASRSGDNTLCLLGVQWGRLAEAPETLNDFIKFAQKCEDETSEVGRFEPFWDAMDVLREAIGEDAWQAKTLSKQSITGMHHYRFDQAPSLPHNFAIMGDALLRVNPAFGQGCTKAGQDVTSLDAALRKCGGLAVPDGFAKTLLQIQTPRSRHFFDGTRILDYRFSTTVPMDGETLDTGSFQRKFSEAIIRLAHKDVDVGTAFIKSLSNLEPGIMFMKPSFMLKVLWSTLSS